MPESSITDAPATPAALAKPAIFRAVFWMTGAIASFLAMAVAGRALAPGLDTFEIMTYRSFVGVIIILSIATLSGKWSEISTRHMGLHMVRNVAHFTGQNLWFFAITVVPLAQVFALEFTTPLWVLLLSPVFLSERLTAMRVASALVGFVGILIVTQPWAQPLHFGIIAAALCAVGFAGSIMATKKLTQRVSTLCILFWLTVLQAIFGLICGTYDMDFARPDLAMVPWVVLVGCAGLFGHFCLTTALSIAPATLVSPLDFGRLPAAAILAMIVYAEPIDIWVLIGAVVIFGANYANIRAEARG